MGDADTAGPFCRFCDRPGKLVDAHVIPRAFYEIPPQDQEPMKLVSTKPGTYAKRLPIGAYDRSILCDQCEPLFGDTDAYAAAALLQGQAKFIPVGADGAIVGYELREYDYAMLKLFFMSVLWRAAVSTADLFSLVTLGSFEPLLREMLRNKDPGTADDFAVVLSLYDDRPAAEMVMSPLPHRIDGINGYQLKLHRFLADIKVDRRPLSHGLREAQLSPSPPLLIAHRDFRDSSDHSMALRLVHEYRARTGRTIFRST